MGTGYNYVCKKCGNEFCAYLGVGFLYPSLYQDVMKAARNGKLGIKAKRFLLENPQGAIDPKTVIAQCENCRNYEAVPDLGMYVPKEGMQPLVHKGNWTVGDLDKESEYVFEFDKYDLVERYDHKCPACGGKMHILQDQEPEKLTCPQCGGEMIAGLAIMWD